MITKTKENKILFTTRNSFDETKAWIKENESVELSMDDNYVYDVMALQNEDNHDEIQNEIAELDKSTGNPYVFVQGYAKCWDGEFAGGELFVDVQSAVKKLTNGRYDDIEIFQTPDNKIEFHGLHHDGTNIYTISAITKKGLRWIESNDGSFSDSADSSNRKTIEHLANVKCYNKGFNFKGMWN